MFIKKIIAAAAAAVLALGVFTAFPESPAVITASAATSKKDFVISSYGSFDCIEEYIGKNKNLVMPTDKEYVIAPGAFANNTTIESVTIGDNIICVASEAFFGCTNLKSVKFTGSGYLTVQEFAFCGCDRLTNVDFGNRTVGIYSYAFVNCTNLTSLTLGEKVTFDIDVQGNYGVTTEESEGAVGYAYDSDKGAILADGKTTAVLKFKDGSEIKYKQKPITLYVTKGSDAEKYAKNNGIAYKYGTAPSSSTKTSTSSTTKLAAPTGIKGTVSEDKITLKWNKVSGAKAYRVYKYNSKTGKYVKYKDVTGTACTVTGLKSGTKYSFKVYALTSKNGKYVQQTASKVVSYTTKEYNTDYIA